MKTNVRLVQILILFGAVWLTCAFDCGGSKGNEPVTTMHILGNSDFLVGAEAKERTLSFLP